MAVQFPPRNETLQFFDSLDLKYQQQGYPENHTAVDDEGIAVWLQQYLLYRTNGMSHDAAQQQVFADIDRVWNPQPEPEPGTPPVPAVGPISVSGMGYVDGAGKPLIPLACHWGEAFSAYVHCVRGTHHKGWTLEDWRRQARQIAGTYSIIRPWDVLGYYDSGWGGREVTPVAFTSKAGRTVPATPDYYAHKVNFYTECARLKLLVMDDRGDLNSWSDAQKFDHMRRNGESLRAAFGGTLPHLMAGLWAVNEAFHNGVHDPDIARLMLDEFRIGAGWTPSVRGLSDYDQSEEPASLNAWSVPPATVTTVHPLRDPNNPKRMLEHYWSNGYGSRIGVLTHPPLWYTEPIGPGAGVSVGRIEDVEYLCALALASVIGGSAYTYMSGYGVFWDGPIEQQPGFREVPQAIALLPSDIHFFRTVMHSGERAGNPRMLAADDSVGSRFDYALHDDGRFAGMAYSAHGAVPMRVVRSFRGRVYHPATRAIEWEGSVSPGQQLPLSGEYARLVLGQLQ